MFCMWHSDLDQTGQAQVDAPGFLRDFHVTDGDVGHNGQYQGLQRLVKAVWETLGPWHLKRWAEYFSITCTSVRMDVKLQCVTLIKI